MHVYTRSINGIYCSQDCLATISPFPYYIGDRGDDYHDVAFIADPDSMWIVRLQLFFTCTVHPPTQLPTQYTRVPKIFIST